MKRVAFSPLLCSWTLFVLLFAMTSLGCGSSGTNGVTSSTSGTNGSNGHMAQSGVGTSSEFQPPFPTNFFRFLSFNGDALPTNGIGKYYPHQRPAEGTGEVRLASEDEGCIWKNCLETSLQDGLFYLQFNAKTNSTPHLGFARQMGEVSEDLWDMNTYDRFTFWIQKPTDAIPLMTTGQDNMKLGTYVKNVAESNPYNDESGGGHWYHHFNVGATGTWTKCIANMHPHHLRDKDGGIEHGIQEHPTGEADYNYFDAMTRFYISEQRQGPDVYPATYRLDEMRFFRSEYEENDDQVYSICATYVAADNRLLVTWSRPKDEMDVKHEVRFATENPHVIGWGNATPAPNGVVSRLGWGGYNGMLYDTSDIELGSMDNIFVAIKPQNSNVFSVISLPLDHMRVKQGVQSDPTPDPDPEPDPGPCGLG